VHLHQHHHFEREEDAVWLLVEGRELAALHELVVVVLELGVPLSVPSSLRLFESRQLLLALLGAVLQANLGAQLILNFLLSLLEQPHRQFGSLVVFGLVWRRGIELDLKL